MTCSLQICCIRSVFACARNTPEHTFRYRCSTSRTCAAEDVDADNRIQCSEIRSLLGEHGEAPLEAEELEELLLLADPGGTGYCDVATFRALPCWQLPAVDAQGNPRSQVRPRALPGTRPAGPPSI